MFFSKKKIVIATHNGGFHPDDVFAVSVLAILFKGEIEVIRTRDINKISKADYVIDVGNVYDPNSNRFDHHQIGGAGERDNGIPYASFGLVWKKYGEQLANSKAIAEVVDRNLVQYIDADDNGVGELKPILGIVFPFTLATAIANMNPVGDHDPLESDRFFIEAVFFAKKILNNELMVAKEELSARLSVEQIYKDTVDKRLIILDDSYPWFDILKKYPEPLFVIEPEHEADKGETYWSLRSVRDNPNNFINRKDLPESWAGKRDEELADVTGVADAIFCHNKRFMAVAKTKEGAIKLANLALESKV